MTPIQMIARARLSPSRSAFAVLLYKVFLICSKTKYSFQKLLGKTVYKGFFSVFFRPKKSAFMTLLVPSEPFAALGISPLMVESFGGIMGSLGLTDRFMKTAARAGLPDSLCTFHKMHLSFALEGGFNSPRFAVASSALCDSNIRAFQELQCITGTDLMLLDFPDPEQPGAAEYLGRQIETVYFRMAEEVGVSHAMDRIKRAVALSEEVRRHILAINDMRKTRWLPGANDLVWNIMIIAGYLGTEDAVKFYGTLLNEFEKKGEPIPADYKRILLMHLLPVYPHPAFLRLFESRALIAMEEFVYIDWPTMDVDEPFLSIARRALSWSLLAAPEKRTAIINRIIDEYSIDGVIHNAHWGCRQSAGPIHAICRKLNRPLLNIETDLVDCNSALAGQLSTRIEGFLEMLGQNPRVAGH